MGQGILSTTAVRVLQVGLALLLGLVLWRIADGEQALRLLQEAELGWLLAAFVALSAQTFLSAERWRLTAHQLGVVISRPRAVQEYYLSQVINQALPGGILGDASRAVRARNQAGLASSAHSVVLERVAGQVALIGVMAFAFFFTLIVPGGVEWPPWLIVSMAVFLVSVVALPLVLMVIQRNFSGSPARLLGDLGKAAVRAFSPPPVFWAQAGLSVATALCNVAGFTFAAWAIGSSLPPLWAVALVPMILLAMTIPLTIGGWGIREGAAAALFPLVGASSAEGLAASVAFGLVFLAVVLPGVGFVRARNARVERHKDVSERGA